MLAQQCRPHSHKASPRWIYLSRRRQRLPRPPLPPRHLPHSINSRRASRCILMVPTAAMVVVRACSDRRLWSATIPTLLPQTRSPAVRLPLLLVPLRAHRRPAQALRLRPVAALRPPTTRARCPNGVWRTCCPGSVVWVSLSTRRVSPKRPWTARCSRNSVATKNCWRANCRSHGRFIASRC